MTAPFTCNSQNFLGGLCVLDEGHSGWHSDGHGVKWTQLEKDDQYIGSKLDQLDIDDQYAGLTMEEVAKKMQEDDEPD